MSKPKERVRCPSCGAANPSLSKFCFRCGTKIPAPTPEKPAPQAQPALLAEPVRRSPLPEAEPAVVSMISIDRSAEMRRTNWLLYLGAGILSAWIVCWTGIFIYSLGVSASHGHQELSEVAKSMFVGIDLVPYIFLMYVPLWVGITFVWMDALWHEEPLRPKQYCKYCAAKLGADALFCEQCGKKVT